MIEIKNDLYFFILMFILNSNTCIMIFSNESFDIYVLNNSMKSQVYL